jgi:hypothetical protein
VCRAVLACGQVAGSTTISDQRWKIMDVSSSPARECVIPEDLGRLKILESEGDEIDTGLMAELLTHDFVVLARNVAPERADGILHEVAAKLGLLDNLRLQAEYAEFLGHRQRVGKYRMTVNKRGEYQFIPPHSEGDSFTNMQLASFYCFENSTDGGETILMNVDDASEAWKHLRERITRLAPGSKPLRPAVLKQATALHHLHSPPDVLPDDEILGERKSSIPGLMLVDVLAKPRRTRSTILGKEVRAYWQSIAIPDHDALHAYVSLLNLGKLLRHPQGNLELRQMDNVAEHRIWSSNADYQHLFKCKITHKLTSGDLILQNNLTWTHAVSNWSPGSGVRNVSAAFA